MEEDAIAFSLSALLDDLAGAEHGKLRGLIEQVSNLHSIRTDLNLAEEAARSAAKYIDPMKRGNAYQIEAAATLAFGIILYTRATKSDSDYRKTFDLRKHFTVEELRRHNEICHLRDDAVAHFGLGSRHNKADWSADELLVMADGLGISGITRRQAADRELVANLIDQTLAATRSMQILWDEKSAMLHEIIVAEHVKGGPLIELLLKHPFSPEDFLGSSSEGQHIVEVMRKARQTTKTGSAYQARGAYDVY